MRRSETKASWVLHLPQNKSHKTHLLLSKYAQEKTLPYAGALFLKRLYTEHIGVQNLYTQCNLKQTNKNLFAFHLNRETFSSCIYISSSNFNCVQWGPTSKQQHIFFHQNKLECRKIAMLKQTAVFKDRNQRSLKVFTLENEPKPNIHPKIIPLPYF